MLELLIADVAPAREQPRWMSSTALFLLAGLLLLTAGAALRLYHLGERSLWFDEAVTANASRGALANVLEKTRHFSAPLAHPYVLYVAERLGPGAVAARMPSTIASILVIIVMLAMIRTGIGVPATLLSAAMIAFSASQVRYAQEVREYSLSVLIAVILVYCLLRWNGVPSRNSRSWLLYSLLFLAPLVQYGLVFFSAGLLTTMLLLLVLRRDHKLSFLQVTIAAASLGAGSLLAFFSTLRYQLKLGSKPWYLAGNYYDHTKGNLLQFVGENSRGLLTFLLPGRLLDLCIVLAILAFCIEQILRRKAHPVLLLVLATLSINIVAATLGIYPYGAIRQCLFLAPAVTLLAGVAFASLIDLVKQPLRAPLTASLLLLIVFSLWRGMRSEWPYQEYEDTRSILKELARSTTLNDQVWVNHDAVDAMQFYQGHPPGYTYGVYHADRTDYLPELQSSINPGTRRVWLVFSHLQQPSDRAEEQLILNSLRSSWDLRQVLAPMNTALYVANRRIPGEPVDASANRLSK